MQDYPWLSVINKSFSTPSCVLTANFIYTSATLLILNCVLLTMYITSLFIFLSICYCLHTFSDVRKHYINFYLNVPLAASSISLRSELRPLVDSHHIDIYSVLTALVSFLSIKVLLLSRMFVTCSNKLNCAISCKFSNRTNLTYRKMCLFLSIILYLTIFDHFFIIFLPY